jgi:hypothetical protein
MKVIVAFVCSILIFSLSLSAQKYKTIVVLAGTKMEEYFPADQRYRYPEFIDGQVVFKNGTYSNVKLDYYYLTGEMSFIQAKDTLIIAKKKEVSYVVAQDTFFYDNGYIELISGGKLRIGLKQYVKIKDVLKKGAYGTTNRNSSIDTYKSLWANNNSYTLIPNEDIEVQMTLEYFISDSSGGFLPFSKKTAIQLFPQNEDNIKAYIKSNKVDFESRADLLKFADYLRTLNP